MKKTTLTTANGNPVADDNHSITAGNPGPLTLDNWHLLEKLAHFNRERIPERVVHARGTGAYGHFVLTQGLADFTIADFLQQEGEKTPVFVRFSTVGGGQDSSDYARDPRGFAVKFYTKQGNWDLVGNNTPVFFIRDPSKFTDFIHSQKKNPQTNLPDPAAMYEFWANHPQSLHQITILMSDRGIPYSYRFMNGYASHTLSFWNKAGKRYWVKFHLKTNQGIRCLTDEEAAQQPLHGSQQDLVDAINRGDFPSWSVKVQIVSEEQARQYHINPFDLTKVLPHADFPLVEIGQLTLDRNVENYFAETEQSAFSPSNLVPGIGASPDKVLQARLFAYADAHRYRVGSNYQQLPVNAPTCPVHHYQRDGAMAGMPTPRGDHNNQDSSVNFYPNDQADAGAPQPLPSVTEPPMPVLGEAWIKAFQDEESDDYSQAGNLFRLMNEEQKQQLIANICGGLKFASPSAQERMLAQFSKADPDYGARIKACLAKSK